MGFDSASQTTEQGETRPSIVIAGTIPLKEMRKITRRVRSSILGPTSVYYAGVTAPAIAAGMGAVSSSALERAGWDPYWVVLTSGIIACMAGISWYLIFMRLSYRHAHARATEGDIDTRIEADELGIYWKRGEARGRVSWAGVQAIEVYRTFIAIRMRDAGDAFVPLGWFENKSAMKAFAQSLEEMKGEVEAGTRYRSDLANSV